MNNSITQDMNYRQSLLQMKSKQFWMKPVARILGACMSTMY